VVVLERQSISHALSHAPCGLPAVAVLGMRLRPLVERQRDGVAAEGKPAVPNPVRERHQRKTCEAVGRSRREIGVRRRAKPVMTVRPVDPVKVRERAADVVGRRRSMRGRTRMTMVSELGVSVRAGARNSARFSLKYRGGTNNNERDHERAVCAYPQPRRQRGIRHRRGSGIGPPSSRLRAQRSNVAFVDTTSRLDGAARGSRGRVAPARFIACDLRDIAALQAIVRAWAMNRAHYGTGQQRGERRPAQGDRRHPEYWKHRIAVNLRHQFFAAQAVYPQMKAAGGGSIVNFGSISWMNGEGNYNAYTTSKAAVHGMTRGLARDWGVDHIRVNTVVPGWVLTQRQIDLWLDADGERQLFENQCLKEKLYPPDIARMVLWLAADDSRLCTAQNFIVDAGWK
jgi:NAD(P)-dependent dehydrogenase (short-subunit alcohol dehydrogenase family)